jgi:hypothetical protein
MVRDLQVKNDEARRAHVAAGHSAANYVVQNFAGEWNLNLALQKFYAWDEIKRKEKRMIEQKDLA